MKGYDQLKTEGTSVLKHLIKSMKGYDQLKTEGTSVLKHLIKSMNGYDQLKTEGICLKVVLSTLQFCCIEHKCYKQVLL